MKIYGLTPLHLRMAAILWSINGAENAVEFARGVRRCCPDIYGPMREIQGSLDLAITEVE